jgi:ComF family protein
MARLARLSKTSIWPLFQDFFALFFPNYCLGCNDGLVKGEDILCTRCLAELPKLDYYQTDDNPIVNRFIGRVPMKHGWALFKFQKEGIVQNLLHQLKYNNHPEVGIKLGKILSMNLVKNGFEREFDLLIPVPLHRNRRRKRGYNQSAMIAKGIEEVLHVPFNDSIMIRAAATNTQTKKSKIERWENVSNAFQLASPLLVSGKRILLVDDVITTGATIEACAKRLLEAGAAEVSIACLAEVL